MSWRCFILLLILCSLFGCWQAHASRHCLNKAEAARTWPDRKLMRDDDGCFTYRRDPPPLVPLPPTDTSLRVEAAAEPTLSVRWPEVEMVQLRRVIPPVEPAPRQDHGVAVGIALALATLTVVEVVFMGWLR